MFGRLFQEHPRSLGMSWAEHGAGAVVIGARMIGAGLACIIHAVGPGAVHRDRGEDGPQAFTTIWSGARRARPIPTPGPTMKSDDLAADVVDRRRRFFGNDARRRAGTPRHRSLLIEGSGRAGRGTALFDARRSASAQCSRGEDGRLGRPARRFRRGVEGEGYEPGDFVPRRRFGDYLAAILDEARASGLVTVATGCGRRPSGTAAGWSRWPMARGSKRGAGAGQGNQPPGTPGFARGIPRAAACQRSVERRGPRSGHASRGERRGRADHRHRPHHGRCRAQPRRGPTSRADRRAVAARADAAGPWRFEPAPVELGRCATGSVLALWRWLRRRGAGSAGGGGRQFAAP